MPGVEADGWNRRYRKELRRANSAPREWLVQHASLLPASGIALDLAAGNGSSSAFLARLGFSVLAVDFSSQAVHLAAHHQDRIQAILADAADVRFAPACFDIILNFYFLERSRWPDFYTWLKPGGLLFFETLTEATLAVKPNLRRKHLLRPGELQETFLKWEILDYHEGWMEGASGHSRAVASLVARKPAITLS